MTKHSLKQRLRTHILTITLLVVFLGSLFLVPSREFLFILAGFGVVAAFEWLNLAGFKYDLSKPLGLIILIFAPVLYFLLVTLYTPTHWSRLWVCIITLSLMWVSAFILIYVYPKGRAFYSAPWIMSTIGGFVLVPTFFTFFLLYSLSVEPQLMGWLLYPLFLTWIVDFTTYFIGKTFGKHPLAPLLRSGKTWEGILGAFITGLIFSFLGYEWLIKNTSTDHQNSNTLFIWFFFNALLITLAIVGDLFENLCQRIHKVQNSGILGQISSLTAVLPLYTAGILHLI